MLKIKQQKEKMKQFGNVKDQIMKYFTMIKEFNIMAEELEKPVSAEAFISSLMIMQNKQKNSVMIKIKNYEEGRIFVWSLEKFENRVIMAWEMLNQYFFDETFEVSQNNDPFWDPIEQQLFAQTKFLMKCLAFFLDNLNTCSLVSEHSKIGSVEVEVIPVLEDLDSNEYEIENPMDAIGLNLQFDIVIKNLILFEQSIHGYDSFIQF